MPCLPLLLPCPPRSAEPGRGLPPHRPPRQPSFSRGWRQGEGGGGASLPSSAPPSRSLPASPRRILPPLLPSPCLSLALAPRCAAVGAAPGDPARAPPPRGCAEKGPSPRIALLIIILHHLLLLLPPAHSLLAAARSRRRWSPAVSGGEGARGHGRAGSGRVGEGGSEGSSGAFPSLLPRCSLSVVPGAELLWLGSHRCAWVQGVRACI